MIKSHYDNIFAQENINPYSIKMSFSAKIRFILLFLAVFISAYGQTVPGFTIKGFIFDNLNEPVEAANITVLSAKDSTLIGGTSSDRNGKFRLRIDNKENCIIKISFIGYKTEFHNLKDIKENTVSLNFKLHQDTEILNETVITAEAPPVIITGDTISYSAAAIPLHDGAVLEDLIKKIPGAELGENGKILLNGKEINKIMIDGKEFFTNNPEIALKNLPADAVKEVKTYDRKSETARATGIDDGEENNVLDVTIKEGMKKGWFGNIILGGGYKDKYESGAMINRFKGDMQVSVIGAVNNTNGQGYNDIADADVGVGGRGSFGENTMQTAGVNFSIDREKFELHADVSYNHNNQYTYRKDMRETFLTTGSSFETKLNSNNVFSNDLRNDIRLRWKPDSLTTINIDHHSGYRTDNSFTDISSATLDNSRDSVNKILSFINDYNKQYSFNGHIMINRRLGKKGRNITLDIGYGATDSDVNELNLSDTYFHTIDSMSIIRRKTNSQNNNINYRINLSYTEPLWKDAFIRLAYRYNSNSSKTLRVPLFTNEVTTDLDIIRNNSENYNNRHIAEATLQGKFKIVNYNLSMGIVPITTHTEIHEGVNAGLDNTHRSLNFQPMANMVIRLDNRRQIRLTYRGMSVTPSATNLQEVIDISDPMNLKFGNPELKNSYNQSMIMSYSGYNAEKGSSIMMHIMANNTINGITQRTIYDYQTGVRATRAENINGNWQTNAMMIFNSPLKNKKFNAGTNLYTNYSHRVGYSSIQNNANSSTINISDNVMVGNKLFASYRNEVFDCYLAANFDSNITRNNQNSNNDRNTFNFGVSGNTNINLPWDMFFSTDISYTSRRGYSEGYNNNYVLWNAQISKNFLKNKQATIRIKVYDILQSKENTFRTMAFDYTIDTETNIVGSYFIVHFVYRINSMNRKGPKRGPGRGPRIIPPERMIHGA